MNSLITIATFRYPHDAYVIKGKLESEGVRVFLKDELTIQTYNFISNAVGGIKMQVEASEYERAASILKTIDSVHLEEIEVEEKNSVLQDLLAKSPLLTNKRFEIRLLIHAALVLFSLAIPIIFLLQPSEAEIEAKLNEEREKLKARKLNEYYLPLVDSFAYYDPKRAISLIDKLQIEYPSSTELQANLGVAYYYLDSFEKSIFHFEKVLDMRGWDVPFYLGNIAECQIKLEDYEGAIESFKKASERDYSYWINIAQVYENIGDLNSAVDYLNKYLERKRRNAPMIETVPFYIRVKGKVDSLQMVINARD